MGPSGQLVLVVLDSARRLPAWSRRQLLFLAENLLAVRTSAQSYFRQVYFSSLPTYLGLRQAALDFHYSTKLC